MVESNSERVGRARSGRLALVALALVLTVIAAACGSSKSTADSNAAAAPSADEGTPVDGGSLVVGVTGETAGWNPHYSEWAQPGAFVGSAILEPLAAMGEDNGAKPFLATKWFPNDTFDKWQVTLRDDVTFQNGEPFNAAAVKANVDDAIKAPLSSQAIGKLFKSVSVVDDHNVLFEMNQPWAAFPSSFLDGQSAFMMAPGALATADHGNLHPIGTGPFTFDSWTPDDNLKVKKNTKYWQAGQPHLDQIEFKVVTDNGSRANALQSGDLNMMLTASGTDANSLDGDFTVVRDWDTEAGSIILNTIPMIGDKPNPLSNAHARMALAYATDRVALASLAGDGVQPTSSPFAPNTPWGMPEDQNNYPNHDVEKAKAEVQAYEQETGATSLSITLSSIADVDTSRDMQAVQNQWREAGIDVDLESVESAAFIGKVIKGDYEAAQFRIFSSPDPDQNHFFWSADTIAGYGGVNINMAQYSTPQIEADLKVGRENGYPEQRKAAYDDLVKQVNGAAVDIWTNFTPWSIVADKHVHGLASAEKLPFGNFQPKTWWGEVWHQ